MQRRPPRSTRFPYATLVRSALGWAGYGLFLVFVVIAGRAKVTVTQLPAALAGLVLNVVLLVLLVDPLGIAGAGIALGDRKSTRLNSSHANISYAVFCLKKHI